MKPTPLDPSEVEELGAFLGQCDLTVSGLDSDSVALWIVRDTSARIIGSTGFELSLDRRDVLVRSVAVHPDFRGTGNGMELARFALDAATAAGAERAWLFSRRSGEFWMRLGFVRTTTEALGSALAGTHQVELFRETGQLEREVAWTRILQSGRRDELHFQ